MLITDAKLVKISLHFTMIGEAWGGFTATRDVDRDFMAPGAPHSPWSSDWTGLRDALLEATHWGDVIGNMGEIDPDAQEPCIAFHLVNAYGHSQTIHKPLRPHAGIADFFVRQDA